MDVAQAVSLTASLSAVAVRVADRPSAFGNSPVAKAEGRMTKAGAVALNALG